MTATRPAILCGCLWSLRFYSSRRKRGAIRCIGGICIRARQDITPTSNLETCEFLVVESVSVFAVSLVKKKAVQTHSSLDEKIKHLHSDKTYFSWYIEENQYIADTYENATQHNMFFFSENHCGGFRSRGS